MFSLNIAYKGPDLRGNLRNTIYSFRRFTNRKQTCKSFPNNSAGTLLYHLQISFLFQTLRLLSSLYCSFSIEVWKKEKLGLWNSGMQDSTQRQQFICELVSVITKKSEFWIQCAVIFSLSLALDSDYLAFFFLIFHFSGLGHDDSEYIDVSEQSFFNNLLLRAFKQSGFANQSLGEYELLPCSLGWFVNASSEANNCIECPAGKLVLSLGDNTSLNRGDNILICLWYWHFFALFNVNFIEYQM